MPGFRQLLRNTPEGLYCPPGDFHIDPVRPVAHAVITHGHSDHARSGHGAVLATPETLAIMAARYGEGFATGTEPARYGDKVTRNGVAVTLVPAGHVLGSAQVVLTWKGITAVISGDYKRRGDPTCAPFQPVPCHLFVSEATFGLPVFHFPPAEDEVAKLLKSVALFPERTHLVGAYALGKAQRLIAVLRSAGYEKPIYVHGALAAMNALYQAHGVALGLLLPATDTARNALPGEIVIAPPSAIADKWARRFADPIPAFASGWMMVRARARQRHVELPLVLSDHADWDELVLTVNQLKPQELWITHGNEEALLRWAQLTHISATALEIAGYEDEEE
jgi:putative mRNA 3-end processing factor